MESAIRAVVERAKERHALNVIPVKVRHEDVCRKGLLPKLAFQRVTEHTKPCAAVEDVNLVSDAHFYAGGIAPIAQILGLWSGRGTTYAPKLNLHKSATTCELTLDRDYLPVKMFITRGILQILSIGGRVTSDESLVAPEPSVAWCVQL